MDPMHDNSALIEFAYNQARRSAAREQSQVIRSLFANLHQAMKRKLQRGNEPERNPSRLCA